MSSSDEMPALEEATKVEELDSSDDDMPGLEEAEAIPGAGDDVVPGAAAPGKGKQTRQEKKARKALTKLGLKPYPGIKRVVIKRTNQYLYVVAHPDVFKAPNADTYVVFGEAHQEDQSQNPMAQAASQMAGGAAGMGAMGDDDDDEGPPELVDANEESKVEEVDDDEEVDATGIDEKDIELVMEQALVSKSAAIKALKKSGGEIVDAIMELS
jgi:nascent polypeptide-associated complex subunit alpha